MFFTEFLIVREDAGHIFNITIFNLINYIYLFIFLAFKLTVLSLKNHIVVVSSLIISNNFQIPIIFFFELT